MTHHHPDISVVMSVYNNADTLQRCLDSILTQEGVTLEFIVINDGSTDATAEILDAAAGQDERLIVIHQSNQGLTRSLIDGCERAKANWIARQDADDVSLPGRLKTLLALTKEHADAVMVSSACNYMGPRDEFLCTVTRPTDPSEARQEVRDLGVGPPAHGTVMFLKSAYEAVGRYRTAFYYGQDADLWRRLAEYGGVAYAPEILYQCRLAPGDISGSRRKIQKQFGRLAHACQEARLKGQPEDEFLAQADALAATIREGRLSPPKRRDRWASAYLIGSLLEHQDPKAAREYFRESISFNVWAIRPRLKLLKSKLRGLTCGS